MLVGWVVVGLLAPPTGGQSGLMSMFHPIENFLFGVATGLLMAVAVSIAKVVWSF